MPGSPRGPRQFLRSFSRLGYSTAPSISSIDPNYARLAGGTSVTIRGANLLNVTSVLFGSTPATNVVTTATSLTCTVPAASIAGAVDVSAVAGSQIGVAPSAFTYIETTISQVSPAFGPIAGGTQVMITGVNFVTGSTITLGGTAATGVTFIDSQHYLITTPAHALGFVNIVITDPTAVSTTLTSGFQYSGQSTRDYTIRGSGARRNPGIRITDALNNVPNTCTLTIDGKYNKPNVGEPLRIIDTDDGSRLLFAGTVLTVEQCYGDGNGDGSISELLWNVSAIDFGWLLNRRRPYGSYFGISASLVAVDLIARFAPGFTTTHVQTNLPAITIILDGTLELSAIFTKIAAALGGGHWYVDYNQDVHLFRVTPQVTNVAVGGAVPAGGTAIVAALGSTVAAPYLQGIFVYQTVFVYNDGSTSGFCLASNPISCATANPVLSSIPTGSAIGALTCVKRRIYVTEITGGELRSNTYLAYEVQDNTTTGFTDSGTFPVDASKSAVKRGNEVSASIAPVAAFGVDVPYGGSAPTATQSSSQGAGWAGNQLTFTPSSLLGVNGRYHYTVYNLYADLSLSQASAASNDVVLDGLHLVDFSGIAIGSDVNGIPVIARLIAGDLYNPYSVIAPSLRRVFFVIPNNTATAMTPGAANGMLLPAGVVAIGPDLESTIVPDEINNSNTQLLRHPPFKSRVELSQIRNKVTVLGQGITTVSRTYYTGGASGGFNQDTGLISLVSFFYLQVTDDIDYKGSKSLTVPAATVVVPGSSVMVGGVIIPVLYSFGTPIQKNTPQGAVSVQGGPVILVLRDPLPVDVPAGTTVHFAALVQDLESQKLMGAVELDASGNATDGIHEYTVIDTNLATPEQLKSRGYAELAVFAYPVVTVTYATRDPKTRSGAVVSVNLTSPPCVGDFLIQTVEIDQIYDESESLIPRYSVTASSTKFTLEDLLLQIIQNQSDSAGSNVSLSDAVTGGVGAPTAVATISDPSKQRTLWAFHMPSTITSGTPQIKNVGLSGTAFGAIVYEATDSPIGVPPAVKFNADLCVFVAAAGVNNTNGMNGGVALNLESNFDLTFYVRTRDSIADVIFWAGLSSAGTPPLTKSGTNIAICAFRYAPLDGDGGWVGVVQPGGVGHSQTTTGSRPVGAIAASTDYKLRMYSRGGPTSELITVSWQVNDGAITTLRYADTTATAPGSPPFLPPKDMPVIDSVGSYTGQMDILIGVVNKSATLAKRLSWRRTFLSLDNNS